MECESPVCVGNPVKDGTSCHEILASSKGVRCEVQSEVRRTANEGSDGQNLAKRSHEHNKQVKYYVSKLDMRL
jgi:hypothetical protein